MSSKSPATVEITLEQCPRVPKENGGLVTNSRWRQWGDSQVCAGLTLCSFPHCHQ
jgi:hypothetical protein